MAIGLAAGGRIIFFNMPKLQRTKRRLPPISPSYSEAKEKLKVFEEVKERAFALAKTGEIQGDNSKLFGAMSAADVAKGDIFEVSYTQLTLMLLDAFNEGIMSESVRLGELQGVSPSKFDTISDFSKQAYLLTLDSMLSLWLKTGRKIDPDQLKLYREMDKIMDKQLPDEKNVARGAREMQRNHKWSDKYTLHFARAYRKTWWSKGGGP